MILLLYFIIFYIGILIDLKKLLSALELKRKFSSKEADISLVFFPKQIELSQMADWKAKII